MNVSGGSHNHNYYSGSAPANVNISGGSHEHNYYGTNDGHERVFNINVVRHETSLSNSDVEARRIEPVTSNSRGAVVAQRTALALLEGPTSGAKAMDSQTVKLSQNQNQNQGQWFSIDGQNKWVSQNELKRMLRVAITIACGRQTWEITRKYGLDKGLSHEQVLEWELSTRKVLMAYAQQIA